MALSESQLMFLFMIFLRVKASYSKFQGYLRVRK